MTKRATKKTAKKASKPAAEKTAKATRKSAKKSLKVSSRPNAVHTVPPHSTEEAFRFTVESSTDSMKTSILNHLRLWHGIRRALPETNGGRLPVMLCVIDCSTVS